MIRRSRPPGRAPWLPAIARRRPSRTGAAASAFCVAIALGAAPLAPAAPAAAQAGPLDGLDAYIERGMRDWSIPGLAIAVVKDDGVVYARGFGVRRLGAPELVDEHTLFGVASVSKAFTAAALGMLVDEGRLHWDDPVVRHLPDFQLYDPYVTRATTVRDLLAHRVGIGRMTGNRLTWLPNRERAELIRRIRHLDPERGFREGYVYSNVGYAIAGEVITAVTGQSWEAFVAERILAPLGMTRSNTSVREIGPGENAAWPHQEIDGRVVEIPRRDWGPVAPAAAINSSVAELAAWMRLHLGEPGAVDGRRLLSDSVAAEMHRAQTVIPAPASAPLAAYGFGWSIASHAGRRISRHGGATDGMNTLLTLVPEEGLGVVVVTNTFNTFMNALSNHVIDAFLDDVPQRGWHELFLNAYRAQYERASQARQAIHAARVPRTRPSGPLADFTGRFHDDLYAEAEVLLEDGRLVLRLWDDDSQVADLEHWHHDTFRAVWRNRAMREEFLWFTRARDGRVDRLHIDWALRPDLLQVGAYPSGYRRVATWRRVRE